MANTRQARKRILVNAKKRLRNMAVISAVKTIFKKADEAILVEKDPDKADELVKKAIKKIDKAACKGMIHKNKAARKKSRLMLKLNRLVTESKA